MKVGYTVVKENQRVLEEIGAEVVYQEGLKRTKNDFLAFLKENVSNDIYVINLKDLGMQLIQLLPCLTFLKEQNKVICFLDKGEAKGLSNEAYLQHMLNLAEMEHAIIVDRTIQGIRESTLKGIKSGRPTITLTKINQIQTLYHTELKPLREIAIICEVSLGTAHKYTRQIKRGTDIEKER